MQKDLTQRASDLERRIIEAAEAKAQALPDYRTGDLAHALVACEATRTDRFSTEAPTPFEALLREEESGLPTRFLHRQWERRNW